MANRYPLILNAAAGQLQELPTGDSLDLGGESILGVKLGSQGVPSISFTGDTDTGLFSPGANQVAISTAGTGRLFVASDGTIGIGQTSDNANYRLNVFNPSADFCAVSIGNNVSGGGALNGLVIAQNQADALFINRENGYAAFFTNSTERMRLTSAGLLGLGTSNPGALLSVVKNAEGTALEALRLVNQSPNQRSTSSVYIGMYGSEETYERARILCGNPTDFDGNNGFLSFWTRSSNTLSERVRITSAGLVGIGTTSPGALLDVAAGIVVNSAGSVTSGFSNGVNLGGYDAIGYDANDLVLGGYRASQFTALRFYTAGTERARIDSSGRLLVGTSTARTGFYNTTINNALLQIESTSQELIPLSGIVNSNSIYGPALVLGKSRGATTNSATIVQNGDTLGTLSFQGADGTQLVEGASVTAYVDGTPGADDLPSRLVFSTTADGAASPTERLRITSAGNVGIGNTTGLGGLLGVSGNISLSGAGTSARYVALLNETSTYAGSFILQAGGGSSGYGGAITMYGNSHASYPGSVYIGTSTSSGGSIIFGTDNAIDPASERMRIDSFGRLGLGVSSPTSLLHLADAGHITVGTTTGTKFGTATTQKIGFYNATPVVQPTAVADATTAVDVITQLNALLAKLRTLGIIAT